MDSPSSQQSEQPDEFLEVVEMIAGNDEQDGAQVTVVLNGKRLAVSLFASTSTHDHTEASEAHVEARETIDRTIGLISQSLSTEDFDEQQALEDEALQPILDAAKLLCAETTTSPTDRPATSISTVTLDRILFPETSYYRLEATEDGLRLLSINSNESYGRSYEQDDDDDMQGGYHAEIEIDTSLPQYLPSTVEVAEELVGGGGTVCRVTVDGRDMLCKARPDGIRDMNLEREEECLRKMAAAIPDLSAVRVPALLGYVKHPRSGIVLGILREWVPSKSSLRDLQDEGLEGVAEERRRAWARQITETVEALHAVGLVWGDVKPGNVIIGFDDKAWLIDFGGGWTEGWVDEDIEGTVEGDKQGVKKMIELLGADA
ncbi:hypothetical protein N8I77_013204 [Diaporthe amygdali]|uniref:Protein kinase domain-containing protein n=1 Tax=Phomopsis amygdali TaxID=1214568 RepID=A0AAD9S234_PHOAM|nr:hypothetical protein N8I77_013204 [Diaporthe amygdali]